ncbi:unnamed protein product, partial [Sphacelaria rigidula]
MVVYLTKFRRDIYLKATHWNERLVAAGQLLTTLKKYSDRRMARPRTERDGGVDRHTEEHIQKAIKRLLEIKRIGRPEDGELDELQDRAEVAQAMDEMLDQVEVTGEVMFALDNIVDKVEEHYEVYRTVEDMVELIDRRSEVEGLLEAMIGATEQRVAADDAAQAAAIAANLASENPKPRPVSELRRLFAGAGTTPSIARTGGATGVGAAGAAMAPSTRALSHHPAGASGGLGSSASSRGLQRTGYGYGSGPPSGTFGYFGGRREVSTAAS